MKRVLTLSAAFVAAAVGLTGCAANSASTAAPSPSSSLNAALTKLVPAQIESTGQIAAGANFAAPPFAMYASDGKTPSGAMVTIVTEAARRLGLKATWSQVDITAQTPALQTGRILVTGSATAANPDIIQQVNVVGVYQNLQGLFSLATKSSNYHDISDVCGKSVSVAETAAATIAIVNGISEICTQAGMPALKKELLAGGGTIALAVQSGRADVGILSVAQVAATVQQSKGQLAALESVNTEIFSKVPAGGEGFTVGKNQPKLAAAFQASVQSMMDDGTYAKIMKSFNVPSNLYFTKATLNDGSSHIVKNG